MADESRRVALIEEVTRVQHNAHFTANIQFAQAAIWRGIYLLLNIPTAILAALAGGIALSASSSSKLVGALALLAAALGGVNTALDTATRQIGSRNCANSALEIRNAARQLIAVDIYHTPLQATRERLQDLTNRLDEVHRIADPPSRLAMRRGRKHARETLEPLTIRTLQPNSAGQLSSGTTP
jgi:hypothetical protein